jgi:hypothetical protein
MQRNWKLKNYLKRSMSANQSVVIEVIDSRMRKCCNDGGKSASETSCGGGKSGGDEAARNVREVYTTALPICMGIPHSAHHALPEIPSEPGKAFHAIAGFARLFCTDAQRGPFWGEDHP